MFSKQGFYALIIEFCNKFITNLGVWNRGTYSQLGRELEI